MTNVTRDIPDRTSLNPETTSEERTWAAVAHASTVLTILIGLGTGGVAWLILPFVPLVIYLSFRDRSAFITRHAAQAFAVQILGSFGLFVLALMYVLVLAILSLVAGVLSIILIGLILIPVIILVALIGALVLAALPFLATGFSVAAAIETANGRDFRYPYIGRLVVEWLERFEDGPEGQNRSSMV